MRKTIQEGLNSLKESFQENGSLTAEDREYLEALREISKDYSVEGMEEDFSFFDRKKPLKEDPNLENLTGENGTSDENSEVPEDLGDLESPPDELVEPEEGSEQENGISFSEKYPETTESLLKTIYEEWVQSVKNKPFVKTIRSAYELYMSNTLNFLDRDFLWRFIKAISSCLTHLLIEGEQREEALCLVDKYYDSIVQCLNGVVHASDREDVVTSFRYMTEFLGIAKEFASLEEASEEEKAPDKETEF